MPPIRVMTYNVHHGVGLDARLSLERVAAVIAAQDPDVVALQELDVARRRTGRVDQPARLAELLRMDHHFHPTVRVAREQYGTAVLSRWPMRKVRSGLLPTLHDRRLEDRGAIWVEIDLGVRRLQVVSTHLGLLRAERRLQAQALLGPDWLAHPDCSPPRILCGDLNMHAHGEVRCFNGVRVRSPWEGAGPPPRTFPSLLPLVAVDHIFFSEGLTLASVHSPRDLATRLASDHLPVVASFDLEPAAA